MVICHLIFYIHSAASIASDLNTKGEQPLWPLTCYGPFKHEATLIGGLDESPEELRVKAVAALASKNVNEYVWVTYYVLITTDALHRYNMNPVK